MILVDDIGYSWTSSIFTALTLLFGAGEKVLQVAIWRPFPAGTKGGQTLTAYNQLRFGIHQCGPIWLFPTGSITTSGVETPCVAPS